MTTDATVPVPDARLEEARRSAEEALANIRPADLEHSTTDAVNCINALDALYSATAPAQPTRTETTEEVERVPFGVPGHCFDINGDSWHEIGKCPGAIVNCDGKCCGYTEHPHGQLVEGEPGHESCVGCGRPLSHEERLPSAVREAAERPTEAAVLASHDTVTSTLRMAREYVAGVHATLVPVQFPNLVTPDLERIDRILSALSAAQAGAKKGGGE